jgi:hypothetical protein
MSYARPLASPPKKDFTRSSYARSFALCVLACVGCLSAFADTATFFVSGNVDVTLPNLTNVSYAIVSNNLTVSPFTQGNVGLVFNSQSFSFNNGILSYDFDPASGSVSSPSGTAIIVQNYDTILRIINTNNFSVEMPVTTFLNYDGGITSTGTAMADSEISVSVLQLLPTGDLGTHVICVDRPDNCSTFTVPGPLQGPLTSPVTFTTNFVLPADSSSMFDVRPQQLGFATLVPPLPEPGTFVLLGTGSLAFIGTACRKFFRT